MKKTEKRLYAMLGCVKNIAKGRYWLTPRFRHLFKILSAITLDLLSAIYPVDSSCLTDAVPARQGEPLLNSNLIVIHTRNVTKFVSFHVIRHSFFLIDECIPLKG